MCLGLLLIGAAPNSINGTGLTSAQGTAILVLMGTTLIIEQDLLDRARELTGITEKAALVHAGLQTLIAVESAKRLAALGGTEPDMVLIPRRRSEG